MSDEQKKSVIVVRTRVSNTRTNGTDKPKSTNTLQDKKNKLEKTPLNYDKYGFSTSVPRVGEAFRAACSDANDMSALRDCDHHLKAIEDAKRHNQRHDDIYVNPALDADGKPKTVTEKVKERYVDKVTVPVYTASDLSKSTLATFKARYKQYLENAKKDVEVQNGKLIKWEELDEKTRKEKKVVKSRKKGVEPKTQTLLYKDVENKNGEMKKHYKPKIPDVLDLSDDMSKVSIEDVRKVILKFKTHVAKPAILAVAAAVDQITHDLVTCSMQSCTECDQPRKTVQPKHVYDALVNTKKYLLTNNFACCHELARDVENERAEQANHDKDSKKTKTDKKKNSTDTFTHSAVDICNAVKKELGKTNDIYYGLNISSDFKQFLHKFILEFINKLGAVMFVNLNARKLKTVSFHMVNDALKMLMLWNRISHSDIEEFLNNVEKNLVRYEKYSVTKRDSTKPDEDEDSSDEEPSDEDDF